MSGGFQAQVTKLATWKVAALAFASMFLSDLISTAMVIFEAHYQAQLAGLGDVLGYIVSLVCSVLALDSILQNGVWNRRSLTIIAAISLSNYAGTVIGVMLTRSLM